MSLGAWYRLTFVMHHKYSWTMDEMEGLYPFELDLYATLLAEWLEMEKKAADEARRT